MGWAPPKLTKFPWPDPPYPGPEGRPEGPGSVSSSVGSHRSVLRSVGPRYPLFWGYSRTLLNIIIFATGGWIPHRPCGLPRRVPVWILAGRYHSIAVQLLPLIQCRYVAGSGRGGPAQHLTRSKPASRCLPGLGTLLQPSCLTSGGPLYPQPLR